MLIVLLAFSALISGAEVAFFSLTPSDFETNEEKTIAKKKVFININNVTKREILVLLNYY